MEKGGWVYIVTNISDKVLYIGVTSDLPARLHQHRTKAFNNAFTSRYCGLHKLVYVEPFYHIEEAIVREKQLKGWARFKKIRLIEYQNPGWQDLSDQYL